MNECFHPITGPCVRALLSGTIITTSSISCVPCGTTTTCILGGDAGAVTRNELFDELCESTSVRIMNFETLETSIILFDPPSEATVHRMGNDDTSGVIGFMMVEIPSCTAPPACPVRFEVIEAHNLTEFVLDSHTADDIFAFNDGAFTGWVTGSVGNTVMYEVAAGDVTLAGGGTVDGTHRSGGFPTEDDITGSFNLETGVFTMTATNLEAPNSVTIDFDLVGNIVAQPPLANAGGDQTVSCNLVVL